MLVSDKSAILEKMWKEPAANANFLIALSSGSAVYASSPDGADGFVVVEDGPNGTWAWMNVTSCDEAVLLLQESEVAGIRWLAVMDATIADAVSQTYGFRLSRRSQTYSADRSTIRLCSVAGVVKDLTPDSMARVLEFANTVANDHPSWESKEHTDDWQTVACFVEDGDEVVGYADSIAQPGPLREIGYVFVKPEARGNGYGKMLVSAVTDRILAAGDIPLYMVDATNQISVKTCESVGYQLSNQLWTLEKMLES